MQKMTRYRIAMNPIAPTLGQRIPLRGPARLLTRSYINLSYQPSESLRRVTTKFGDQFDINLSVYLEWCLWAFGAFEGHLAELFTYLVRPGDRCIDVGANVGVHTVRLAKLVGDEGSVIAVEADEEQAGRARNNIALNGLANVLLVQAAATRRGGESVILYRPDSLDTNKARASVMPHPHLTGTATSVPTVAIDDVVSDSVAFMKIDVESHEAAVVEGAARTIDKSSPAIIFEYCPGFVPDNSGTPIEALRGRGYHLFDVRNVRNRLTGRGSLALQPLLGFPDRGTDILAVCEPGIARVRSLIR